MLTITRQAYVKRYNHMSPEQKKKLKTLNRSLDDNSSTMPFEPILDRLGFFYALKLLDSIEGHEGVLRYFACWCSREFLLPTIKHDKSKIKQFHAALNAAELYSMGEKSLLGAFKNQSPDNANFFRWNFARLPGYFVVLNTIAECINAVNEIITEEPDVSAGQIVSENDVAAIAFFKRCRLKFRVVPANAPSGLPEKPMTAEIAIEKMTVEFRDLCRLEGKYTPFKRLEKTP